MSLFGIRGTIVFRATSVKLFFEWQMTQLKVNYFFIFFYCFFEVSFFFVFLVTYNLFPEFRYLKKKIVLREKDYYYRRLGIN